MGIVSTERPHSRVRRASGHSLAGNLHEGLSRECRKQNYFGDLATEFTAVERRGGSRSEKERLLRRCWSPGRDYSHTHQTIKILRAARGLFLETSGEIFVRHQFSNLPAK